MPLTEFGDEVQPQVQSALPPAEASLVPNNDAPKVSPFEYFDLMGTTRALKESAKLEAPTFNQAFLANIEKDSFVYNSAVTGLEETRRLFMEDFDPDFDFFQPKYLTQASPEHYATLSDSLNENDFYRRLAKINQEQSARDIAHRGSGWAALAASVPDLVTNPFNMISIAKGLKLASTAKSFLSGAARALPGLAAGATLSETALYLEQQTRPLEEVGVNIAAQTMLGVILGGTGNAFRTAKAGVYKDMFKAVAEGNDVKFKLSDKGEIEGFTVVNDSVGAMSTKEINFKGEALYGWGDNGEIAAAKPLMWLTGKLARNPVILGLTSKSSTVRAFTNDAYDHNFHLAKGILEGKYAERSVQNKIDSGVTDMMSMQFDVQKGYYEYLGIDATKEASLILQDIKSKYKNKSDKLTNEQYNSALYYTIVTGEKHPDNFINTKANEINEKYNKPIQEELTKLGYLSEEVDPYGAANHLSRLYDNRGIMATRPEKREWLIGKFNEVNNDLISFTRPLRELEEKLSAKLTTEETARIKQLIENEKLKIEQDINAGKYDRKYLIEKDGKRQFRKILESRSEIEEAADKTIDNILGTSEEQMYSQIVDAMGANGPGRGFLEDRALLISDKELIKGGWLVTDINKSLSAKLIRTRRMIELDNYFKSKGWDGKTRQLDFLTNGIYNDYKAMEQAIERRYADKIANAEGKEKERLEQKRGRSFLRLERQRKRDIANVSSTYKRISGSYDRNQAAMVRNFRIVKQWAYSTQLGAALLPALQDAFSPIFRGGLSSYVQHGVAPFIKNLAKMSGDNSRFRKDARDLALGIETVVAYFGQRMPQSLDYAMPLDFVEAGADALARGMSIFNMSSTFTDAFQAVAATATQSRLIRDLKSWKAGYLSDAAREQLQVLRLNPDDLITIKVDGIEQTVKLGESILQQFDKHGDNLSGGYLMNWQAWDQPETRRLFQSFVKKEVKSVIFAGNNIASFPQGVDPNAIGSAFLTYMGYSFNAAANFLIPAVQRPSFDKLQGIAAMTAMGMLIDPLRQLSAGKEVELEPGQLIKKGILNAGWGGILVDGFNRVNATFDFAPALQVDKFRDKDAGELLLGAPGSLVVDAVKVLSSSINGEWNEKDLKMAKRMTPLLNLIYLRQPFNAAIESLELPKTRHEARQLNELGE